MKIKEYKYRQTLYFLGRGSPQDLLLDLYKGTTLGGTQETIWDANDRTGFDACITHCTTSSLAPHNMHIYPKAHASFPLKIFRTKLRLSNVLCYDMVEFCHFPNDSIILMSTAYRNSEKSVCCSFIFLQKLCCLL